MYHKPKQKLERIRNMVRFKLVKDKVNGGTVLIRVKEKSDFKSGGMVESGEA